MGQNSKEAPKVSASNTKKEILEAYNRIKDQLEAKAADELRPEEEKEIKQRRETKNAAENLVKSGVSESIDKLKANLNASLSEIAAKMEEAVNQYARIKKAIEVREQELNDLFGIEKSAFSLAALIETQKQQREEFETSMAQQRDAWKKEQDEHAAEIREQKTQTEKNRKREEEEYEYHLKRERDQKTNALQDEMNQLEREIAAKKEAFNKESAVREEALKVREDAVQASEKEMVALQVKVDNFSQELDAAVSKAVKENTARLTAEAAAQAELMKKTFEGEKNVLTSKIDSLEHTVSDQRKQIDQLAGQLEKAYGKVQDIAVKAVSGHRDRTFSNPASKSSQEND